MNEGFAPGFAPTLSAAHAGIAAVRPAVCARTRSALDGALRPLSPCIRHGFVTLADVRAGVATRHALDVQPKSVREFGWRDCFRHVRQHRGEVILQSLHAGPLPDPPDTADARELPADIRQARTGVPVVDEAVAGIFVADFHRDWPWSDRPRHVAGRLVAAPASQRWYGDAGAIGALLKGARRVRRIDAQQVAPWLARRAECGAAPALLPPADPRCDSFSASWMRASRGLMNSSADLLAVNDVPAA